MGSNDPTILSRSERGRERRSARVRRLALVWGTVVVVVVASAAVLFGERLVGALGSWRAPSDPPLASVASTAAVGAPASIASGQIEVPDLSGMNVAQAKAVLAAAGLAVRVEIDPGLAPAADARVRSHLPAAGTIVSSGSVVALTVPRSVVVQASARRPARAGGAFVVAIDPGHQSVADDAVEPLGPGSGVLVPRARRGAVGVLTGAAEYEIARQLAVGLQGRLQAAGVKVVLTRTTNDVDVSGSERAAVARSSKADLLVEIHLQSSAEASQAGVATRFSAANQWTKRTAAASVRGADAIQSALVEHTGAVDLGTSACADDPELNWAGVPAVVVEAGFSSNPVEDRLLTGARYQGLVCDGMADGIIAYLKNGR